MRAAPLSGLAKTIGPGIMYAGAAIGVSHLVQSTRAGADYGFTLLWAVVLVHLVKYPFFEFAHRYTAATGDSLLVGYRRLGRWALLAFLVGALGLSVPTAAVLTIVTAGMASQVFAVSLDSMTWALILLACCAAVLAGGGYTLLDRLMKVLMVFLVVCTAIAVVAAAARGCTAPPEHTAPEIWNFAGITFLIALMGWMPTPVDASAWPSLWMQERSRQTGHRPTLRQALFDFNLGYVGSLVMAIMFLSLGALVMFGSGQQIAGKASDFAAQFVSLYTQALGGWSRPVIIAAAFVTMFSTLLTVLDGYPRVLTAGCALIWPLEDRHRRWFYWLFMLVMAGGALLVLGFLTSYMLTLVEFATVVAFLSAPLFAWLNYRVISTARLPAEAAVPRWLVLLAWTGLVFLSCFSVLYLIVRFGHAQ